MSFGSSKSSSKPVDMTPAAFRNLQMPFAMVMSNLLGVPGGGGMQAPAAQPRTAATAFGNAFGSGQQQSGYGTYNQPAEPTQNIRRSRTFNDYNEQPTWDYYAMNSKVINPQQQQQQAYNPGPMMPASFNELMAAQSDNPNIGTDPAFLGLPVWKGKYAAEMTGNEAQVLQQMMGLTDPAQLSAAEGFLNQLLTQDSQFGGGGPNPFLDAAIAAAVRPIQQGLTEQLTRELPGRFTQAGQMIQPQGSSAFDRAAALATRGAADAMGDVSTNMAFQAYDADQNRRLQEQNTKVQGAQVLQGVKQSQIDNAMKNLQAQSLPRMIEEYGIERGLAQFNQQVQTLMQLLQIAGAVTAPVISTEGKSSSFSMGIPLVG